MTHNQRTLNTFYESFDGGWGWRRFGGGGFGSATTTTSLYQIGSLVVDLFDGRTKKLIWRGSSSETLANKSDNNIKKLDLASLAAVARAGIIGVRIGIANPPSSITTRMYLAHRRSLIAVTDVEIVVAYPDSKAAGKKSWSERAGEMNLVAHKKTAGNNRRPRRD